MSVVAGILAALKDPNGQRAQEATQIVMNQAKENPDQFFGAFFREAIANRQDRSLCLNLLHHQFVSLAKQNRDAVAACLPVIESGYRELVPLLGECDQNAQITMALIALGIWRVSSMQWRGFYELVDSLKEKPEFWNMLISSFYYLTTEEIAALNGLVQQVVVAALQGSDDFQVRMNACDVVSSKTQLFQEHMDSVLRGLSECVTIAIRLGPGEESSIWERLVFLPNEVAGPFFEVACKRRTETNNIDVQSALYEFVGRKMELCPPLLNEMFGWYKQIQLATLQREGEMDPTLITPICISSKKGLSDVDTTAYARQYFATLRESLAARPCDKLEASFAIETLAQSFILLAPYLPDDIGPFFVQVFRMAIEMQVPSALFSAARLLEEVMDNARLGENLCDQVPVEALLQMIVGALTCGDNEVAITCLRIWTIIASSSTVSPTGMYYSIRNQHEAFKNAHLEHLYFSFLSKTFFRVCEIPQGEVHELKQYLVHVLAARQIPSHWPAELFLRLVGYFPEMFNSDEITGAFEIITSVAESDSSDGMVFTLSELIGSHLAAPSLQGWNHLRPLYPRFIQMLQVDGLACVQWCIIGRLLKRDEAYFRQHQELMTEIRRLATFRHTVGRDGQVEIVLWMSCVVKPIRHYLFYIVFERKEAVGKWVTQLLSVTEKVITEHVVECLWWVAKPKQVERIRQMDPSSKIPETVAEVAYNRLKTITDEVSIRWELVIVPYMKILAIHDSDKFCDIWPRLARFRQDFPEMWESFCKSIINHCFRYNCETVLSRLMDQFVEFFVYLYNKASSDRARCVCYEYFIRCSLCNAPQIESLYAQFMSDFTKQQDCLTLNLLILQIASGRLDVFECVAPHLPVIAKTLVDTGQDGYRPVGLSIAVVLNFLGAHQGHCPELDAAAFRLFARYLMFSPCDMVYSLAGGGQEYMEPMIAWFRSAYGQFGSALESEYAQQPLRLARLPLKRD